MSLTVDDLATLRIAFLSQKAMTASRSPTRFIDVTFGSDGVAGEVEDFGSRLAPTILVLDRERMPS
jgi:hypothetical protein